MCFSFHDYKLMFFYSFLQLCINVLHLFSNDKHEHSKKLLKNNILLINITVNSITIVIE